MVRLLEFGASMPGDPGSSLSLSLFLFCFLTFGLSFFMFIGGTSHPVAAISTGVSVIYKHSTFIPVNNHQIPPNSCVILFYSVTTNDQKPFPYTCSKWFTDPTEKNWYFRTPKFVKVSAHHQFETIVLTIVGKDILCTDYAKKIWLHVNRRSFAYGELMVDSIYQVSARSGYLLSDRFYNRTQFYFKLFILLFNDLWITCTHSQ